jgi:hypothetical protein
MDAGTLDTLALVVSPVVLVWLPSTVLFNVSRKGSWQRVLAVVLFIVGLALTGLILSLDPNWPLTRLILGLDPNLHYSGILDRAALAIDFGVLAIVVIFGHIYHRYRKAVWLVITTVLSIALVGLIALTVLVWGFNGY